ncbi:hypothetical protein HDU78_009605 [Chytriomyces hyalinus]|nr:hypothetical protein HDU78_009605 [Chytriomyces hyalinus]
MRALIFCIYKQKGNIYYQVKHLSETKLGLMTQGLNKNDMPAENKPEFQNEVKDSDDEQKDWTPRLFSQQKPANQSPLTALKPWLIDPELEDEAKTPEDIQVDIKLNAQAQQQETRKRN